MEQYKIYHEQLPKRIRTWLNDRKISNEIIDRFFLGWNGRALTIPIFDMDGNFSFFKYRKDPVNTNEDMPRYWYDTGHSYELYGWENIRAGLTPLVICEGELDRLAAESAGFPAITSTGGAGTFKEEWAQRIQEDVDVYICFDNDDAGRKGMNHVIDMLPRAKIVFLPEEVGDGGDITDFFVKLGKTPEDFKELLKKTISVPQTLPSALSLQNDGNSYRKASRFSVVNYQPVRLSELTDDEGEIKWIWHGFLAKGHITLFDALWKAGKTTFVTHLIKAIASNTEFVGQYTAQTDILVVSEEGNGLWVQRRNDFGLDCWVLTRPIRKRLNCNEWIYFVTEMAKFCDEKRIGLFILDTVSAFWCVDDENSASKVQTALLPLNSLLEQGVAVLLIHHFRKSGGDEGVAGRGSGALSSYVDIIIELRRLKGDNQSNERVLKMYSRFNETPQEIVVELLDNGYLCKGSKSDALFEKKLQKILEMIKVFPEGATATELRNAWGDGKPTKHTIRNYLRILELQGKAYKCEERMVEKSKTAAWKVVDSVQEAVYPTTTENHDILL